LADPSKAAKIDEGESYIKHIPASVIREMVAKGLAVTTDFSKAGDADVLIICVTAPLMPIVNLIFHLSPIR